MAAAIYPNQKTVIIKKTPCKTDFLQISNSEWQEAVRKMDRNFGAFKLYLYLAANEIDYEKGLSFVAIEKALRMSKSAYYEAVKKLEEYGYLVDRGRNKLEFYTTLSATAENSAQQEISREQENSAAQENVNKNLLSAPQENSGEQEKADKNLHSAEQENSVRQENQLNSAPQENGWDVFNF